MSIAEHDTIILEPRRLLGQGCCAPVPPRLHNDEARAAADLFKALADPTRLHILDLLSQRAGSVCVCDLEGVVGLPDADGKRPKQATISHHLRVLRDAGLVGNEKEGQWVYYFIQPQRLADVQALLDRLHMR